jgi:hypothetical protein
LDSEKCAVLRWPALRAAPWSLSCQRLARVTQGKHIFTL